MLRSEPANNGVLYLNESIAFDFSNPIDITTADLNSVAFQVLDASGQIIAEQPSGTFVRAASPGDAAPGRRLEFQPRFPTNDTYDDGGLRAGRTYLVQLVGGNQRQGNVLLDHRGQALNPPVTLRFSTPDGSAPSQLFRDTRSGGPRRVGFVAQPSDSSGVALGKPGVVPVELRLLFDQPLDPSRANVPVGLDTDPTKRSPGNRGRIFLEYDDPDSRIGANAWIPANVVLSSNTLVGAEVRLYPVGVLPNNADVRVIVENTLQDMAGESNVADAAYDRVFARFTTKPAYQPQFDAMVESFDSTNALDLTAAALEPSAEFGPGFVKASFAFEGTESLRDWRPATPSVILNTDFTQIQPVGWPAINVSGGVFHFRNVHIPAGVVVQGVGSRPMVWLVTGDFTVDGTLTVDGSDGARVNGLKSANVPIPGGAGACGGGDGGRGSPSTSAQDAKGEAGSGPGQIKGGGGQGGAVAASDACGRGSGGGGGSFATAGDPYYKRKQGANNSFAQQNGIGGFGCQGPSGATTRNLPGGGPGPKAFVDPRLDNDFYGTGVDLMRQIRITGELATPQGGAGGGGGGDQSSSLNNPNWISDRRGAGGGAGGGVLIVKCLGTLRIGSGGLISARGGHGGGGEEAGGNTLGGGGGGGSGGLVVLMAGEKIEIVKQGETYANNDWSFPISADGGVGTQAANGALAWSQKYPPGPACPPPGPPPQPMCWDSNPSGGFGGLGVIQLMAPAGKNDDGTNTVLDDNIVIQDESGVPLTGTEKIRFLGWRGFAPALGAGNTLWIDDAGNPTYANGASQDDEGDIRPAPILLPVPFSHLSVATSKWLDLGSIVRRPLTSADGQPRGIVEDPANGLRAGPSYLFAGTNADPNSGWTGYLQYTQVVGGVALLAPRVLPNPAPVASVDPNALLDGQPAYEVILAQAALGKVLDRYAQYQAELLDGAGSALGRARILSHSDQRLWLSFDQGPLPDSVAALDIVAQFVDVRVAGTPGLGPTYLEGSSYAPFSNVKIGFAFHRDATRAKAEGSDPDRLPSQAGSYLYDLADPAVQESVRTFLGSGTVPGAPFVQWYMLFNTRFSASEFENKRSLTPLDPSNPRPEVHGLVLPYRF